MRETLKNLYSKYLAPQPMRGKSAIESDPEIWGRKWEFLFRASDLLWANLGDRPLVYSRRLKYLSTKRGKKKPTPCSEHESARYGSEFDIVCKWIAEQWSALFDEWMRSPDKFIFEDGFSVLFLLRILWANDVLLFRGHYDSRWSLTTSLARARQRGAEHFEAAMKGSRQFLDEMLKLEIIRRAYSSKMPETHQAAVLQHYGFPTDLLDCTYSYDVALYFAEGGSDFLPEPGQETEFGAIYAFPTHILPQGSVLLTLPPAIMRPSLQRGVFIASLTADEQAELERYKFVFRHQMMPVWNGIGNLPFGTPVGLGQYLFPVSDPLESLARPLRKLFDH